MRKPLLPLGILGLLLASTAVPLDARAQDDERRVLRMRQVQDDSNETEEMRRLAEQKRLESINFLKDLLARGDAEGDRKAEMMLRLADMYFQQGRAIYLREMAAFDVKYDECFNTEGCNLDGMQPDNSESREWQERSIRLYQQILRNYPRFARADEATFYLASALQDLGRRDEARGQFETLVNMYPDSGFVPDAHVAIGEYWFDNENAYKALLAYKKATAYQGHNMYGFALYKLGWCYYNVGEYGDAINTMKQVVSYSQAQGGKLQLQDEALKDLVRFFADAGELDEAYAYFSKLGKKDLIKSMLKRLASMYFEQGKWEESVQTYRRLIAENPTAPDNPEYQNEIVQAYQKMGREDETFTEIDRMLKTYGKDSAWARANASDQDAVQDAEDMVEKNLRQVAYHHHNRAKKLGRGTEATNSYALAYKAYKVYLTEFPESSHTYEVRYSFAELLYKTERFDEAYEQYMAVVALDPQGKHSKFCAESAIFAADEIVKNEAAEQPKPDPDDKSPKPLTEWEQRLVDACKQYADLYPEDDKVKNIIYKSAYLLYNKFRFPEAAEQFNAVIKMDPKSREAEQAANLILDSFVVNEDWDNLKKNAQFYYEQEGLGSRKFKDEVYGVYQRASLKLIEVDFEQNQDHGTTADALVAFYEEFPESEELPRVLNNATVYYHEAGRVADAMKVRHILVEDPKFGPKTKYYYDQLGALGYDYETIADFDKAATYYEKMFALYPKHRETAKDDPDAQAKIDAGAADALYSAAVFRRALGDWQQAIDNYKKVVAQFPEDERVDDIQLTIGRIYEEQERWSDAANVYYAFYSDAGDDTPLEFTYFARLQYGKALEAQNQQAKATRVYEDTVAAYQEFVEGGGEPGAYTEFVAEMMFTLAQPRFDRYAELTIDGPRAGASRAAEDKAVTANLKAKADALVEVEKLYADIIRTGAGEWGLAALVQLGRTYENMGESLENSHIPSYLTSDQREMYVMALEDKVYPQVEKAVQAYKTALDKSYELTLYNDRTAYATRRLGELRPDDYPGLQEQLPEVRLPATQSRSFSFETER